MRIPVRIVLAPAVAAATVTVLLATTAVAAVDDTTLVSRSTGATGAAATGHSSSPAVSADGRFVAFVSSAGNLSDQDDDALAEVYLRDRMTGTTVLVSRADGANGAAADGDSSAPSISADGRHVAFVSTAGNLSDQDLDTCADWYVGEPAPCSNVFVRDLQAGTTTLASRADGATGAAATGSSYAATVFPDGNRVAFTSVAENLSAQDVNECTGFTDTGDTFLTPCFNVFVRDLRAGTTALLSPGLHLAVNRWPGCAPAVAANARHVAVETDVALTPADTNEDADIYLLDLQGGTWTWVSSPSPGGDSGRGRCPSVSADGGVVAFVAYSSRVDGCCNGVVWDEVYARDVATGVTTVVSRKDPSSAEFNKRSGGPSVSGDGRYVAFDTEARYLSPNGPGVYVRDLQAGTFTYVSRASGADGAAGGGGDPALSTDGRIVAFTSSADNLSEEDGDQTADVFVRELAGSAGPPPAQADLSVAMTASTSTPAVGSTLTFTVTLANGGPAASTGAVVAVRLPAGLQFVSAAPAQGSYDAGAWTVGGVAAGSGATLQLVARASTAGTHPTTAELTAADQPDPDSAPGNGDAAEDDQAGVTVTAPQPVSCTGATVVAAADTFVRRDAPSAAHGSDAALTVRSRYGADARALVRFALPPVPQGCTLTGAKLRMYATTYASGRTLRATPLGAAWDERTVSWSSQPASTGTAASTSARAGWVEWTVTGQVGAMYSGRNNGFQVRDASESGSGATQRFDSRENISTRGPQLVVTFGPL